MGKIRILKGKQVEEKIYNLIENEDGTLTAVINEGVICLEEYPFMPKLFERMKNKQQWKHFLNPPEKTDLCTV